MYLISIDIDWAPDAAIDAMAQVLIKKNIKATWFVTHNSPAIARLKEKKELFELGIHPNFLPNSTHGKSVKEIMEHVMSIIPDATTLRTHGLVQSSPLLKEIFEHYPITIDSCILLRESPNIQPHRFYFSENGKHLLRVPFFWEDDEEMVNPDKSWSISNRKYHCPGLKIFNFHPMYFYLNCDTMNNYSEVKKIKPLYELTESELSGFINTGNGVGVFFEQLTTFLENNQSKSYMIRDFNNPDQML